MARKPLININEMYCGNEEGNNPAYNMLLSGNMIPVKEKIVNAVLQKNNLPVIIINLDNTSSYMASVRKQPDYVLGNNQSYDLFSSMSIRDACIYLQNVVYEKPNGDDQSVQIIRYLKFIEKLNNHLGLELHTIRDINNHYYQPDIIGKALTEMYQAGKISPKELDRLNVSLVRGIKGQLIIDDLMVSTDYNLNCEIDFGFSVNNLQNGQTAFLDLSVKNNSYIEKKNRNDVLYSVKEFNRQMIMLLNVGRTDYQLISDFILTMTAKKNCQFVVIMDDVFAQVQEYDQFRKKFSLNLLGQHTGKSCSKMSECFHEIYRQETHYASSVNHRLFSDSFLDVLLGRNHTDTTTQLLLKRKIIEEKDIIDLTGKAFILMNNTGVTNYFSIYNI